MERRVC